MAQDTKLTTKQVKAIPVVVAASSYDKGCKTAKISRTTLHSWMQDETFAAEFDRQRNKIADTAFGMIAQNIEKAVSTLVGLLDTDDDRVKRLAANDIIGHFLKNREMGDLGERIKQIEGGLESR